MATFVDIIWHRTATGVRRTAVSNAQGGEFGYNRDGERGKLQIVIGLLADSEGEPLAVRVFSGNTGDPVTVADQIKADTTVTRLPKPDLRQKEILTALGVALPQK